MSVSFLLSADQAQLTKAARGFAVGAVRLLAWRALDAVTTGHPSAPELALHAEVLGSETGVEVINELVRVVGVTAYDEHFPILGYVRDAPAHPLIGATPACAVASSTTCSARPATTRRRHPG